MKIPAFILALLFCSPSSLFPTTYYVTAKGNDANDGTSLATAFLTIQTATNKVVAGDTVLVHDGYYKGFDHFYLNSGTAESPIVYLAKGSNVVINQDCGRGYDAITTCPRR